MKNTARTIAMVSRKERGVVLFIALVVLIAMTIAGISLVRSMDTANQIAGNLAFRQSATHAADVAIEQARAYILLKGGGADLYVDSPIDGYYSFREAVPYWSQYAWATKASPEGLGGAENTYRYVIHRLCSTGGDPSDPATECASNLDTSGTQIGNSKDAEKSSINGSVQMYYRVTARVMGPRNTVSYVQAVILN